MICSKAGATRREYAVRRMCAMVCAAGGVAVASASCSSSVTPPQAYVSAQVIGASPTDPGPGCNFSSGQTFVTVGAGEKAIQTGTMGITVACTVSSSGSGFSVQGNITTSNSQFTIMGTMTNNVTEAQTGILGSFSNNLGGYSEQNCTVSFTPLSGQTAAMNGSTGTLMGVYPGRVWGNLTCPAMAASGGQTDVCEGTAEFKFEDCNE